MENEIQVLLDERIVEELDALPELTDEEKDPAIKRLSELMKMRNEEMKVHVSHVESTKQRDAECEIKREQLKGQSKDRWLNFVAQIGLGIAGLIAYDIWYRRGLKFEEEGSVRAPMTRNLITGMLPKKWR